MRRFRSILGALALGFVLAGCDDPKDWPATTKRCVDPDTEEVVATLGHYRPDSGATYSRKACCYPVVPRTLASLTVVVHKKDGSSQTYTAAPGEYCVEVDVENATFAEATGVINDPTTTPPSTRTAKTIF